MKDRKDPVIIIHRWPSVPGHCGRTEVVVGYRYAVSVDGRWWCVRRRGLFRRLEWLPVCGTFTELQEVNPL